MPALVLRFKASQVEFHLEAREMFLQSSRWNRDGKVPRETRGGQTARLTAKKSLVNYIVPGFYN